MKTQYYISVLFLAITFGLLVGCDKVENPYEDQASITVDTTLYPGNWQDYVDNESPVFTANSNTDVNVLLEDYTGHLCNNCPTAATAAHTIHENYPDRVFVASIHVDPGAVLSFQQPQTNGTYPTDHTNPDAIEYGETFQNGFNFIGNPQGTVNRKTVDGKMFDFYGTWQSRATDIMTTNDLKFNIQSAFNFYESTNGGYLHVEVEKVTNEEISVNTVVYVLQDTLTDWQLMPNNTNNPNYLHRDLHLGSIDGNAFGIPTFESSVPSGTKEELLYSYEVPSGYNPENMHFLIYVYNTDNYEVLQVIKQKLKE
tara:strand:+ start:158851 stop:159786 length:936 start_codon:yes stop_codon:yes gene_type:complete